MADAFVFTIADCADILAMPPTPCPHMKTFLDRVPKRLRVQHALRAEGLDK